MEQQNNTMDPETKSEDSGPPITYAKVENFQRMKLDLEIDISSHHGKMQNQNNPNNHFGFEDKTVDTK